MARRPKPAEAPQGESEAPAAPARKNVQAKPPGAPGRRQRAVHAMTPAAIRMRERRAKPKALPADGADAVDMRGALLSLLPDAGEAWRRREAGVLVHAGSAFEPIAAVPRQPLAALV